MRHVYNVAGLVVLLAVVSSLPYDPEQADWNINQNQTATSVLDYWGEVRSTFSIYSWAYS